jgi:hypothetical protein
MRKRKTTKVKTAGRRTRKLSIGKGTLRDLSPKSSMLKAGAAVVVTSSPDHCASINPNCLKPKKVL